MQIHYCRHQRYFSKKSGRWSSYAVKSEKTYPYCDTLKQVCLKNRLLDGIGMNQPAVLDAEDPRRIFSVFAPVQPPLTGDLVAEKKKPLRFSLN
jgi:hypothetical protein